MATRARGESAPVDDEFLHSLYKGGELLAAGKVIEAKEHLERAHQLQPKNEKGQNLLGLTYFKLGLFDRAAEIYEMLVRDNPVDATLRVNLGLVYLKTNQLQRAIREFETSVDLAPEHKKAHNYLGLALAQIGNYAEARDHFVEAGSDAMVQKMERALAGEATGLHRMPAPLEQQSQEKFAEIEGSEIISERGGQHVEELKPATKPSSRIAPALDVPVETPSAPSEPVVQEQDWGAQFGGEGEAVAVSQLEAGESVEVIEVSDVGEVAETEFAAGTESPLESVPEPAMESAPEDELRFAEDEGPPALGTSEEVISPEDLGAAPPPEPTPAPVLEESDDVGLEAAAASAANAGLYAETPAVAVPEQWEARALGEMKPETAMGLPIAELAPTLELFSGAVAPPFELRPEGVAITVDGELLTRIDGLVMVTGAVKYEPELKRFRGRTTEQAFGEGSERMLRANGRGVMVVAAPEKHRFVAVELAEESAYFREEVVYAFEEPLMFENGRVPSETTGDLDLVHLRGKGKILLQLQGALRTHQVRMDDPVTVPMKRLVGWFGNVTPKLVPLALEESGKLVKGGAELSGEGFVLLSVP